MRGLSSVAVSGGHSSSRCAGLSLSWPLLLRSTGSRRAGSVAVAHGLSCSAACGIFSDQGSNPRPLHWQDRFSTTVPPGKPLDHVFKSILPVFAFWLKSLIHLHLKQLLIMKDLFPSFCYLVFVCLLAFLFLIYSIIAFFCVMFIFLVVTHFDSLLISFCVYSLAIFLWL